MKKRSLVKENSPAAWQIPPVTAKDNKYTRGHVLVLGGAEMTGAARLAALAAQRAGAGLVTLAVPPAQWAVYAARMVSVIVRACNATAFRTLCADARIGVVLIGPGAGLTSRTRSCMRSAAHKPLVLDADALTLLAQEPALRTALRGANLILTPHEGEYMRLAKALKLDTGAEKPVRAQALAAALGAVVVLKGADTCIARPTGPVLRDCPPAWLACGGTGDVLAGIIAALWGQGMEAFDAACAGVWLHAEAARGFGPGMIAEDLIAALPKALQACVPAAR